MVRDAGGGLDLNTPYTYLLFGHYFRDTCLIAEDGDATAGVIVGFRPPRDTETLFVWQIAVNPKLRARGLGRRMLAALMAHTSHDGVRYLEATVTPSNEPSLRMFRGFANDHGVPCDESPLFSAEAFPPGEDHEEERRLRIGPFDDAARQELLAHAPTLGGES